MRPRAPYRSLAARQRYGLPAHGLVLVLGYQPSSQSRDNTMHPHATARLFSSSAIIVLSPAIINHLEAYLQSIFP